MRSSLHALGLTALLAVSPAATHAQAAPPVVPLPDANVTIPTLHDLKTANGVLTVLQQVKLLEGTGAMPVMWVITPGEGREDRLRWSLITIHARMFNFDGKTFPDAEEYLTGSRTLTQTAYALDTPPRIAGQKPVVVLWENERDGVLTQSTLEAIYRKLDIDLDPLTAPGLNEASWNALILGAANKVPDHAARVVILAFRSNGADPDVAATTKLRILTGVEFIKSIKVPVVELDEDKHPEIATKLFGSSPSTAPMLIVFDLEHRAIQALYDQARLPNLNETDFQAFVTANGVPPSRNDRTDIAEAFIRVADAMRKQMAAQPSPPSR